MEQLINRQFLFLSKQSGNGTDLTLGVPCDAGGVGFLEHELAGGEVVG